MFDRVLNTSQFQIKQSLNSILIFSIATEGILLLVTAKVSTLLLKDTHEENAFSNKTPAVMKSMNMDSWVVGISNQLFVRSS